MGRFVTREDEVDDLSRLGSSSTCIASCVREYVLGVESYSIKGLEPLVECERSVDLRDAANHLMASEGVRLSPF